MRCVHCGALMSAEDAPGHVCGGLTRAARPRPLSERRRLMTILFADVCESTRVVRSLDSEAARDYTLNTTGVMAWCVEAWGGMVLRDEGDCVFAAFGAHGDQADQAQRACQAALQMIRELQGLAVLKIGVHSGELLFTQLQPSGVERVDSPDINFAKRLQESCQRGQVRLSAACASLLGPQALQRCTAQTFSEFGEREILDLDEQLLGQQLLPREFSPLLGRDPERAQALELAQTARQGRPRWLHLRGDPGIGKSHLLESIADSLLAQGWRALRLTCRPDSRFQAHALLLRLHEGLDRLHPGLEDDWQQLVLGLEARNRPAGAEDASAAAPAPQRETWVAALRERLAQLEAPLLLSVDDWPQADPESQRIVRELLESGAGPRLLLISTGRSDPDMKPPPAHRLLDLGALGEDDALQLLQRWLPEADLALARGLVERAAGNPLFLEQLALALRPQSGGVGLTIAGSDVPLGIGVVVEARIDALGAPVRELLEAAAVLGEPLDPEILAALLAQAPADIRQGLELAMQDRLLRARTGGLEFRHPLVPETLLGLLTRGKRQHLHAQALQVLGKLAPDTAPVVLAAHALEAGDWGQAVLHARHAIARALLANALREAWAAVEIGLSALRQWPVDDAQRLAEMRLRMGAASVLVPLGRNAEYRANLDRARELALQLKDERALAGIAVQLAVQHWIQGEYQAGLDAAAEGWRWACSARRPGIELAARHARLLNLHALGQYPLALELLERIRQDFPSSLSQSTVLPRWAVLASVNTHVFAADILLRGGHHAQAQSHCDAAAADLRGRKHAFSQALLDFVQAQTWLACGRSDTALQRLPYSIAMCRYNGLHSMLPPLHALLARALAAQGQVQQGLDTLDHAQAQPWFATGGRYNDHYYPLARAWVLQEDGRHAEALDAAEQAVGICLRTGQLGHELEALQVALRSCAALVDAPRREALERRARQLTQLCGLDSARPEGAAIA